MFNALFSVVTSNDDSSRNGLNIFSQSPSKQSSSELQSIPMNFSIRYDFPLGRSVSAVHAEYLFPEIDIKTQLSHELYLCAEEAIENLYDILHSKQDDITMHLSNIPTLSSLT